MIIKRDFLFNGKNRPLHIYLPDDYQNSGERCPVFYFFDGHNLFYNEDATYGKSWGFREFFESWEKDIIMVGIECGHGPDERLREYLPYPAVGRFSHLSPEGDATFRWIIEEVKPVIDRDYPTCPFRECTAIGGSSMGGLMALYGIVHYNQWFSKAACVSSSIGFCMEPLMKDMAANPLDPDSRVYLSWGSKEAHGVTDPTVEDSSSDTYRWNRTVADKIAADGALAKLHCQVGGGHCEADWEKLVPAFMDFLWLDK